MKITKIIFGSLCLFFSFLSLFQSCAVGLSNTIEKNGRLDGSAGLLFTILMFVGGMVLLLTRNGHSGTVPATVIFLIATVVGQLNKSVFGDLVIYSTILSGFSTALSAFSIFEHDDDEKNINPCRVLFAVSVASFLLIFAK